ncbi:MAG: hypothetical protein LCH41_10215 [Armatimonadetes bacterium]|nr:hypothetical protein [Armatimonadota bacterium]
MLWKAHYSTIVLTDVTMWAEEEARVIVGGFGPQDLGDMELWLRLIESEQALQDAWRVDLTAFSKEDREDLIRASWVKKSLTQKPPEWSETWPRRVYAYCPPARLLMIGPATEDAWDQFREAAMACLPNPERSEG